MASQQTFVRAEFAGETRTFRLRIGEVRQVEEITGAGIGAALLRLSTHQWKLDDVLAPLRLGLIGGGMTEVKADAAMMRVFGDPDKGLKRPLADFIDLAASVVTAACAGLDAPGAEAPKKPAEPGVFDELYRQCGALGLDPRRVDSMTFAELKAFADGAAQREGAAPQAQQPDRDDLVKALADSEGKL